MQVAMAGGLALCWGRGGGGVGGGAGAHCSKTFVYRMWNLAPGFEVSLRLALVDAPRFLLIRNFIPSVTLGESVSCFPQSLKGKWVSYWCLKRSCNAFPIWYTFQERPFPHRDPESEISYGRAPIHIRTSYARGRQSGKQYFTLISVTTKFFTFRQSQILLSRSLKLTYYNPFAINMRRQK